MRPQLFALSLLPLFAADFGSDLAFLQKHTEVIHLSKGSAHVAVAPAYQGRVMTSTDAGPTGASYGWINRDLIASKKLVPHMNPFGGEDRFWLGPEGGQFSIFFAPKANFDLASWQTPAPLDTDHYPVTARQQDRVRFQKRFQLTNYSGTRFDVTVDREVRLLAPTELWGKLGVPAAPAVSSVAFESSNRITNAGSQPWTEKTGLLSVWILGMFNASPSTTVVIPLKGAGGPAGVTDDYFGKVPARRLRNDGKTVFFRGDGQFRSKIGVSPERAQPVLGSYDATSGVLTLVQFTLPGRPAPYVNSQWKIQPDPFKGDVINSYSDDGKMGAFYELETSSPAAALRPGQSLEHLHRTIHLRGPAAALDGIAKSVLGVGLEQVRSALPR